MDDKEKKPVEFDDDEASMVENSDALPESDNPDIGRKTEAMDAMDKTAILMEDDLDEVKTQLIENPFINAAKLVILFGPDQGRHFPLVKNEVVIGRALDCDAVLNDPTVSRHHCKVINRSPLYILKDLNSGNGTKLNGVKTKEGNLSEGARIEVGQTTMVFTFKSEQEFMSGQKPPSQLSPKEHELNTLSTKLPYETGLRQIRTSVSNPPKPKSRLKPETSSEPKGSSWGKPLAMIATVVVLLIGVLAVLQWGFGVHILGKKKPVVTATHVSPKEKALKEYRTGLKYMEKREWNDAVSWFRSALKKDPSLTKADKAIETCKKEKSFEKNFNQAGALMRAGHIDEARKLLNAITNDSVYYTDARALLLKLKDKEASLAAAKVKALIKAGQKELAKKLFLELINKYPNSKTILDLADLFKGEVKVPAPQPVHAVRSKRPRRSRRGKKVSIDMNTVFSMYATGNFTEAVEELRSYAASVRSAKERADKTRLADAIQSFAAVYSAGKKAVKSGNYTVAIRNIRQAKKLDKGISRQYQNELKNLLAESYRERSTQYVVKKQYIQAARDARTALSLAPGDKIALMVLSKCQQVAKGYYDSALADLKSGNTASAKLKLQRVMQLVTRDSDLYRQASRRYQQIR